MRTDAPRGISTWTAYREDMTATQSNCKKPWSSSFAAVPLKGKGCSFYQALVPTQAGSSGLSVRD